MKDGDDMNTNFFDRFFKIKIKISPKFQYLILYFYLLFYRKVNTFLILLLQKISS